MHLRHLVFTLAIALAPLAASASSVTYSFNDFPNSNRSASATFAKSGSDLVVTLTNTSTFDAMDPTDILTAVYFEFVGDPLLSRTSAIVPGTSKVWQIGAVPVDVTPGGGIVGGEWAYLNNINPAPPANSGISSTGVGIFGPGDLFPGPDLVPPASPDGVNLGITSAGDNLTTGNGGIQGQWLIKNSVVFTLGGFTGQPDAKIVAASFQYGTALDEPQIEGHIVPEPSTLVLGILGALGLTALRRRTRQHP